jgi:2,4-dienoyl-CoA reductase-like NADH-dependent reductase (Old Yellow Enzyme family)
VIKTQQVSASAVFNIAGLDYPRAATAEDMARLVEDFALGATMAVREIGFDAVELHCGHGYLLSQWMSPFNNRRTDEFGGSAVNRARFPVHCLRAVRKAVGEHVPVLVKMNAMDGTYSGLELPDALIMAEEFANNGADVIVVSCGSVSQNGMYMLRGSSNVDKLALALPGAAMKVLTAAFGPFAVPETPFETCFLRREAREILKRVRGKCEVCLLGGIDSLGEMEGAMEEGFGMLQMIRPLIREPDFLLRVRKEMNAASPEDAEEFDVQSKCIRCNMCVIASVDPDRDLGCPFRNLEVARAQELKAKAGGAGKRLEISQTMAKAMLPDIEDGLRRGRL